MFKLLSYLKDFGFWNKKGVNSETIFFSSNKQVKPYLIQLY